MSNLTIQSTPKTYLDQYPLSTGQIAVDEEGIVIGNSGDMNTCLFESTLNTKLGVQNLDEVKSLLDVVPIAPMPPQGGITFVTNQSGAMAVTLSLCTASTQVQVGGDVTINWGDGSAIQTYTIANPGPTTCSKTANYSTTAQKLVTITCVTATHSILSFKANSKGLLSIDGRNCPKLTTLDVTESNLKIILGFSGVISATCKGKIISLPNWENVITVDCSYSQMLTSLPNWKNVTSVNCTGCTQLTVLPNWNKVLSVNCGSCGLLTSLPNWKNVITVHCDECTQLTSLPNWKNATTIYCMNCTLLTTLPSWTQALTIYCYGSGLLDPSTWGLGSDPWPNCKSFIVGTFSEVTFEDIGVPFGSNSAYINNFYTLLHDWNTTLETSGRLSISSGNAGYAASTKTIATNKDWTVS